MNIYWRYHDAKMENDSLRLQETNTMEDGVEDGAIISCKRGVDGV
jgi:hypothetical protein